MALKNNIFSMMAKNTEESVDNRPELILLLRALSVAAVCGHYF
jgi:hypothetical protein